ncbi:hypothetical protein ACQ4M3_23700 [Leptolyngbya sp. AN03gr2]
MRLSGEAYDEMLPLLEVQLDPEDEFDRTFAVSQVIGEGYTRSVEL